jgi:hypothetical protein
MVLNMRSDILQSENKHNVMQMKVRTFTHPKLMPRFKQLSIIIWRKEMIES